MGSGEVAIVALSTMISLKVTFSDGLGGGKNFRNQFSAIFSSSLTSFSYLLTIFVTKLDGRVERAAAAASTVCMRSCPSSHPACLLSL